MLCVVLYIFFNFFFLYSDIYESIFSITLSSFLINVTDDMMRTSTRENLSSEVCEHQRSRPASTPHCLTNTFVIRLLEIIISVLAISPNYNCLANPCS